MPGDPIIEEACPVGCNACQEACPVGAYQDGVFHKVRCLTHTIRHAIYPLALRDEAGRKNIETIVNTAGYNAWIRCHECQRVCPKNGIKDP